MKKRYYKTILASLFSILVITSCGPAASSSSQITTDEDSFSTCDPMFGDCGSSESSSSQIKIDLERETGDNYTFENTTNAKGSVSYEIFVRSFYDTNNDQIGDFNGITEKLPYLQELGVSNLWLMPIMPSTTYHGYDCISYYDVNPDYGTMADFENLVKKASERNIDIMIDLVLNHSSDQCEWFDQSYQDLKANKIGKDSKADWYAWSDTPASGFRSYKDMYCEARFDTSMPEFNTDSASFRKEVDKMLNFWVNKGVKGFRLDAVKHYVESNASKCNDFMNFMKQAVPEDISFVGEVLSPDFDAIAPYYYSKCDSFFSVNASLNSGNKEAIVGVVKRISSAKNFAATIERQEKVIKERNPKAYSSYFLSNHDMDRSSNSLDANFAKMAANIYLLLPGTPYIYYGEEIGLMGVRQQKDMSDARRRLAMIWDENDKTGECGFPELSRPDLMENEQVKKGANDLMKKGFSLPNHYKKVMDVRNKYDFIKDSVFVNLTTKLNTDETAICAYSLSFEGKEIVVIHNMSLGARQVSLPEQGLHISDSISCTKRIPKIVGDKLQIGGSSTVILTK